MALPPGAKVAVPLFCCPVVFEAVKMAGCTCAFVDIDEATYGMSLEDLGRKITSVSAAVVVHMFGHPVDLKHLRSVTGRVPVIEDCAHSFLSFFKGKPAGSFGDAAFFSFRNGKYLSMGEASVIWARERELRDRIQGIVAGFARWTPRQEILHAASSYVKSMAYRRPLYGLAGYPVGRALDSKLNLSDKTGVTLRQVSQGYHAALASRLTSFHQCVKRQREVSLALLQGLRPGKLILPIEAPDVRSNFYQFAVRLPTQKDRDDLAAFLLDHAIDSAQYLDDVEETTRTMYGYTGGCPVAERCAKTTLILPNHYTLKPGDVAKIVRVVNEWSDGSP